FDSAGMISFLYLSANRLMFALPYLTGGAHPRSPIRGLTPPARHWITNPPVLAASRLAFGLADPAQADVGPLGVALLGAVGQGAAADPGRPVGARVDEHDVGGVHRHLLGEPAALRVAAAGLEVLVHPVDALDHQLVLVRDHAQHPAGGALVVARHHADHVAL